MTTNYFQFLYVEVLVLSLIYISQNIKNTKMILDDSIKSSSSNHTSSSNRQIPIPNSSVYPHLDTSPKQQLSFPQYAGGTGGGNSSPGSSSANSRSTSQSFSKSQGRKSTNAINLAANKRSAPAPPPGSTQVIYGTLPHALRYQGGYENPGLVEFFSLIFFPYFALFDTP
jgi:hypothetical protein